DGNDYVLDGGFADVFAFKGPNAERAKDFMRFLLNGDRLGTYLEASLGRSLPTLMRLLNRPFWQDPNDPHMTQATILLSEGLTPCLPCRNPKWGKVSEEAVIEKAVQRVDVDKVSPTEAADEAIARMKEILSQ